VERPSHRSQAHGPRLPARQCPAFHQTMNYQEAIRIAEEREARLKDAFDRFDGDASGTIDMEEILPLLDDLGMIKKLRTDRIDFVTKKFLEADANSDGTLTFEEFKVIYNGCIDDAAGKKPKPKPKRMGKESADDIAKQKAAEDKCRRKAEESEKIRKENAEIKAKVQSSSKGKDAKELDGEIMNARKQAMIARQEKRKAEQKRIAEENRARRQRLKNTKAKVDDDVLDDEVDLDGDGIADGAVGDQRKKKAKEGQDKLVARDQEFKDRQAHIDDIKKNTVAKVDDDLLDDEVDLDGDGIADGNMADQRKKKAKEGQDKLAAREQDMKERQAHVDDIKKNAVAKVDDDVLDDEVDIDGDGIADGNMAEQRKKKAKEGQDKLAAREQDMKERQAHIDDIKKNTVAKVDDDLLDDEVDIDGDGIADGTMADERKKKAKAGKDKVAARAQDMEDRQAEIDEMKASAVAKVDDELK